jgi:hypothetical protein
MHRTLTAVLVATLLVMTALSPAAVSAQETETTDLTVSLTQHPATGNATVTVATDGTPVEGAPVNVTTDVTYTGESSYTTDANGTFELPNPDQPVEVDVEATVDGTTTTETFTLVPVEDSIDVHITQNDDGTVVIETTQYGDALAGAEVDVSSTVSYAGNDSYTTDANGSVTLPEPAEATEVTTIVTSGDLEAIQTATIEPIAEFEVDVASNDDGAATVTVTRDAAIVENATVNVTSDTPYAGNGSYTTDTNGTVSLPEPAETVNVTVAATEGDDEATTDVRLSPVDTGLAVELRQNSDGTATVTVTDDGSTVENATVTVTSDAPYDGNGTDSTNAEGTVGLPAPDQNVTVTVTATNGSEDVTTTADLEVVENGGYENFGQWVSAYVQQLKDEGYFGKEFGREVSDFATKNNPGSDNRPEHAGPPEREEDDSDVDDEDASEKGQRRGPPAHANAAEEETDDGEETDDESTDETDTDCEVDADRCDGGDDEEGEGEDEDDADDAPGNSGNNGNRGGNGNGNGNGPKR